MHTAHVCLKCGQALSRIRPVHDPYYELNLVRCPGCGAGWVRRRHPIEQSWRTFLRLKRSVCTLVGQLVLSVGLVLGCVSAVGVLEGARTSFASTLRYEPWSVVSTGILIPMVLGIWLTVGLSHWRRPAAWGTWAVLMTCLLAVRLILDAQGPPLVKLFGLAIIPGSFDVERWLRRLLILAIMLAIATSGIPIGRLLLRVYARNRQVRFRKRRARRRARMASQ